MIAKTMFNNHKIILITLLFSSLIALIFAYISQYFFDLEPCILCLHQRKPFFAIIAISFLSLFFTKSEKLKRISIYICALLLIINVGIASYHVLVEKKIFKGPTTCSSQNLNEITNLEDLKIALSQTKAIRCDEPAFMFLAISMAGWNLIYSFGLLVIIFYYIINIPRSKR